MPTQFLGVCERGATGVVLHVRFEDASGNAITNLTYNASSLAVAYVRAGEPLVSGITLEDIAVQGVYVSPSLSSRLRFREVNTSNMPGLYELQVHSSWTNNVNSCRSLTITFKGPGILTTDFILHLTGTNDQDATRGGIMALPAAYPAASGGLPTVDSSNQVRANLRAIDDLTTASGNATLTLKKLTLSNSAGIGLEIRGGNNYDAVSIVGGNPGNAITLQGGSVGHGLNAIGGATSGDGIRGSASTGSGLHAIGGSTSGDAVKFEATAGYGVTIAAGGATAHGVSITGAGSGSGIIVTPGATGSGVYVKGGATSGDAVVFAAQAGADSSGLNLAGIGTGDAIRAAGGANGYGLDAYGGGAGIAATAIGPVSGPGMVLAAYGNSVGLDCIGGTAGGAGLRARSVYNAYAGAEFSGFTTGPGIKATGGTTGSGLQILGGSSSGAAIVVTAQAGNSNGVTITAAGSGVKISGDLAGSVTSVTNAVTANVTQINSSSTAASRASDFFGGIRKYTVGSSSTTTEVRSNATEATGYFANVALYFLTGTLAGTTVRATSYANTNGAFTTDTLPAAPSNGDTFIVLGKII